jgi:hypothetical protein
MKERVMPVPSLQRVANHTFIMLHFLYVQVPITALSLINLAVVLLLLTWDEVLLSAWLNVPQFQVPEPMCQLAWLLQRWLSWTLEQELVQRVPHFLDPESAAQVGVWCEEPSLA